MLHAPDPDKPVDLRNCLKSGSLRLYDSVCVVAKTRHVEALSELRTINCTTKQPNHIANRVRLNVSYGRN
jgi:hypothetical protein